jgi:hypothetical protein
MRKPQSSESVGLPSNVGPYKSCKNRKNYWDLITQPFTETAAILKQRQH